MSSSEIHPATRRRRRQRPVLRALKLVAPFLLLIAVGLLSAGVIHLVETTATPPIPAPIEPAAPKRERPPVDPRQGWGVIVPGADRAGLQLGASSSVELEGILPTSFLEAAPMGGDAEPVAPQGETGFEGPGASLSPQHYPAGLSTVPEPRSAILVAIGLFFLAAPARRGSCLDPRFATGPRSARPRR